MAYFFLNVLKYYDNVYLGYFDQWHDLTYARFSIGTT